MGLARDHPRVCGEHLEIFKQRRQRLGSSPACAGNTSNALNSTVTDKDHPRVCGEHAKHCTFMVYMSGSSPRVRGTLLTSWGLSEDNGIIPACAGNTSRSDGATRGLGDHPRVCGEHTEDLHERHISEGSSPRVRGTHQVHGRRRNLTGIIPACAGNTSDFTCGVSNLRDHPRVCGEHLGICSGL